MAWTDTGDVAPDVHTELEATPIKIGDTVYDISSKVRLFALDAATGKQKWVIDPSDGGQDNWNHPQSRYYLLDDGKGDERIFISLRQYLYAVNAKTVMPFPYFGDQGRVELREGLGHGEVPRGIVYKDMLICGSIIAEQFPAYPGDIRAFDVRMGKIRWQFHTIPLRGEI